MDVDASQKGNSSQSCAGDGTHGARGNTRGSTGERRVAVTAALAALATAAAVSTTATVTTIATAAAIAAAVTAVATSGLRNTSASRQEASGRREGSARSAGAVRRHLNRAGRNTCRGRSRSRAGEASHVRGGNRRQSEHNSRSLHFDQLQPN
ncbi:hypothetical protein VTN49DRAFT_2157 [Thermomyces lanuginosus]|uniref:uncharacterized protein n=1 Tax=Thermomyces lanuginosus TaxID=5541 RepID=UPI003744A7AA